MINLIPRDNNAFKKSLKNCIKMVQLTDDSTSTGTNNGTECTIKNIIYQEP